MNLSVPSDYLSLASVACVDLKLIEKRSRRRRRRRKRRRRRRRRGVKADPQPLSRGWSPDNVLRLDRPCRMQMRQLLELTSFQCDGDACAIDNYRPCAVTNMQMRCCIPVAIEPLIDASWRNQSGQEERKRRSAMLRCITQGS